MQPHAALLHSQRYADLCLASHKIWTAYVCKQLLAALHASLRFLEHAQTRVQTKLLFILAVLMLMQFVLSSRNWAGIHLMLHVMLPTCCAGKRMHANDGADCSSCHMPAHKIALQVLLFIEPHCPMCMGRM